RIHFIVLLPKRMIDLHEQDDGLIVVRIDCGGTFIRTRGLLELSLHIASPCMEVMRFEQIGIGLYSLFELPLRLRIALGYRKCEAARGMRFAEATLEVEGLGAIRQYAFNRYLLVIVEEEERVAIRNTGIGAGIERIELNRLLEHPLGQHEIRFGRPVEEITAPQIKGISLDIP